MTSHGAFYEPVDGDTYLPTAHTEGPWDPRYQHGGPPAAMLTRAVEQQVDGEPLQVARLTFDILGPVPREPLRITAWVERPGKRVRLIRATLSHLDRVIIAATAWAVRPAPDDLPAPVPSTPPPPDDLPATDPTANPEWNCGFLAATEWRFVAGGYLEQGPATAWIRPRIPLLPGETMSPMQRVALTADSANGISSVLDIGTWTFIPPELTIHCMRPPDGEWLCLDAGTVVQPAGVGLASATLYDRHRPVARTAQSLLVSARSRVAG